MTGKMPIPSPSPDTKGFEQIKLVNSHGAEYWIARDLQVLLGYSQWRRFEEAISRAITSCTQSGNDPAHHFAGAGKMVTLGSGSQREVPDYHLSRFACYLIAQNGDPRKPEIAFAQKYFAIQTRRQELTDACRRDQERLELRQQTKEEYKALSGAAQDAGVQSRMFGIFHDAGYKGLYGGLGNEQIKSRKGIPKDENLMDRMDTTELAANQFRMTQAREKLARQRIKGQHQAIDTHRQVGKEVREAIKRIGGTMPENLSPGEHIKQVEKRLKNSIPKLELEGSDAKGLTGDEDNKWITKIQLRQNRDSVDCNQRRKNDDFRKNVTSKRKQPAIAICYDFDGTLSLGNMQEHEFISEKKFTRRRGDVEG